VVGERIAGRYEVEELVGHGGMSSVYRAHDSLLERHVALKILHEQYSGDEDFVERFKREARTVAQLQHPNIVTVIDRGEEDGRQYIVFEYVDGENLKELVVRKGRLDVREALEIALEVARGLAFAHENGLIHRDVKPQNVLLNGDGRAKVTDFGIARTLDVDGMTQTGTVLGTSNYIAPEQASGQRVDAHSDVYSLGAVLYELLAGEVPFPGESFIAVAMKHLHEPPPSILDVRGDVPLRVAAAVDRALEKDPEQRFPTMDAFAGELEAALGELDRGEDADATMVIPSARRAPAHHPRKSVSRWPLAIGVLALLAIAAIVVGLLASGGTNNDGKPVASSRIQVSGLTSYDPFGPDKTEHDRELQRRPGAGQAWRGGRGRRGHRRATRTHHRRDRHARVHSADQGDEHRGWNTRAGFGLEDCGWDDGLRHHVRQAEALLHHLDHEAAPRSKLRARQRSARVQELELQLRPALVAFEGELDEAPQQFVVWNARGLE
jgi:eukaryotic-like serine/threonine-protein kinase